MKTSQKNRFFGPKSSLHLLPRAVFFLAFTSVLGCHQVRAAVLNWDADPADGITAGPGDWNTTAGNVVWNLAGANVSWSQTNITTASNSAVFGGDDAGIESQVVTLGSQIAASGLTFNSTGYKLDGTSVLYLPVNSIIELANGKSATIACPMGGPNSAANWLIRQDASMYVTGTTNGPQQPLFIGETGAGTTGTINFSGTHSFTVCMFNALVNVTGGTFSSNSSFMIGRGGRAAVNGVTAASGTVTLDGADAVLNHNGGGTGNNTMIGRDGGAGTLVIKNGTFNTSTSVNTHDIALPQDNNGNSRGTFDVQGGTVNVGSLSNITAKINFGRVGLSASQTGAMTQSGGTIYCHGGILFGGATAGNFSGTATWTMTGGSLYLGAGGISEGINSPTKAITLSGGTLAAMANWTGSLPMTLGTANGDLTIQCADGGGNPFDITLTKPLTGEGGLKKTGTGKLTLSDINTYSGTTLVKNGTLQIVTGATPSVNGPLTLDGAEGSPTAAIQVTNAGQSWEIGSLTSTGGTPKVNIQFGALAPSSTTATLKVAGDVAFSTLPDIAVSGSAIAVGTYPLLEYSGTLTGTVPNTVTLPDYCSGSITHNPGTKTISLVVNQSTYVSALAWAVGDGIWNINNTPNWTQLGAAVRYNDGNAVTFDDSSTGSSPITITLSTAVAPYSITTNATKDYILTGPGTITGTGAVNLLGSGSLTLNSANTYTGGTILSAGQLNIGHGGDASSSAIGTGPLTLNSGTAIDNTSGVDVALVPVIPQTWNGNFSFVGSANSLNMGAGAVTLTNNIAANIAANTLTVGGAISGDFKLTKTGGGNLALTAANGFTGGFTLTGGGLHVANTNAVGSGTLTLGGGAIDNISGTDLILSTSGLLLGSSFTFIGSNNLTIEGDATLLTPNTPSAISVTDKTLTFTGAVILANSVVTKTGMGTLTYSGSQGNTGGIIVHEGRVNLDKSSGSVITNGDGVRVNTAALLVITGDGGNQIADTGSTVTPVRLVGGTFDLNGRSEKIDNLTISAGGTLSNTAAASTSSLTLKTGSSVTLADISGFEVTAVDGILDLPGPIIGAGTLRKTGVGNLILGGTNTYSGPTLVEAGILTITGSLGASAVTVSDAATLSGNGNLGGDVTLLSGARHTLAVAATADTQVTRVIAGTLTLENGSILDLTPAATPTAGLYVLATATTITGTPTTVNYSGPGTVSVDTLSSPNRLLLTVAGGPTGFAGWITGTFAGGATVPLDQQGPTNDPDHDGISNLVEYAIAGQDPTVANPNISSLNAKTLSFAKREGTSGITYAIVESTDLGLSDDWTEVSGDSYVNGPTSIVFTFTTSSPARNFARLKVMQTP